MPSPDCVAVLVTDPADHVLLVLNRQRSWELPGGSMKPREVPSTAAIREVQEETGLQVQLLSTPPRVIPRAATDGSKSYVFYARNLGDRPVPNDPDGFISVARWFSRENVRRLLPILSDVESAAVLREWAEADGNCTDPLTAPVSEPELLKLALAARARYRDRGAFAGSSEASERACWVEAIRPHAEREAALTAEVASLRDEVSRLANLKNRLILPDVRGQAATTSGPTPEDIRARAVEVYGTEGVLFLERQASNPTATMLAALVRDGRWSDTQPAQANLDARATVARRALEAFLGPAAPRSFVPAAWEAVVRAVDASRPATTDAPNTANEPVSLDLSGEATCPTCDGSKEVYHGLCASPECDHWDTCPTCRPIIGPGDAEPQSGLTLERLVSGHVQALTSGAWEWSPDGGFDHGVVTLPDDVAAFLTRVEKEAVSHDRLKRPAPERAWDGPRRYRSDDRDLDGHDLDLVIAPPEAGGNGDWYVSVVPHGDKPWLGVRVTTSGVPRDCEGFFVALANAYEKLPANKKGSER